MFASILVQFGVHLHTLVQAKALADAEQSGGERAEADADFEPSLINSLMFLLSSAMLVTTFAVNYKGKPYMEPLSANKGLAGSLAVVALALVAIIQRWDAELGLDLAEQLELVPLSAEAQAQLLALVAGDFAGCLLLEKAIAALFRY